MPMDGGSEGSGLDAASPGSPVDRTQGVGTDAWQRATKMAMEVNARNRRN
jgi:hypothetical protein